MRRFPPHIAIGDADPELVRLAGLILPHRFPGVSVGRARDLADIQSAEVAVIDVHAMGLSATELEALKRAERSSQPAIIFTSARRAGDGVPADLARDRTLFKNSRHDANNFATQLIHHVEAAMGQLRMWHLWNPAGLHGEARVLLRSFMNTFRAQVRDGVSGDLPLPSEADILEAVRSSLGDVLQASYVHRVLGIPCDVEPWPELPWEAVQLALPDRGARAGRPLVFARVYEGKAVTRPPISGRLRGVYCEVQGRNAAVLGCRRAFEHFLEGPADDVSEATEDILSAAHIGRACGDTSSDEPVDVLYIVAHADPGNGALILRGNFRDPLPTSGDELARALAHKPPRVVILQTCAPGAGQESTVAKLIKVGVEAVVFFQINPTVQIAPPVMNVFFQHLRAEPRLDRAVWETRRRIRDVKGAWYSLVLAVRDERGLDALWQPPPGGSSDVPENFD